MLAKPLAPSDPEADPNRARAIQRCTKLRLLSKTFSTWFLKGFMGCIALGVLVLMLLRGWPSWQNDLGPTLLMTCAFGFTFLLFGIALVCMVFRLGIVLFCLGKYSLSYLMYNQLLLAATISMFMTLEGLAIVIPSFMLMGWCGMLYAYIREADPEYTGGNQPYFVAKKIAEERMRKRAEAKAKANAVLK